MTISRNLLLINQVNRIPNIVSSLMITFCVQDASRQPRRDRSVRLVLPMSVDKIDLCVGETNVQDALLHADRDPETEQLFGGRVSHSEILELK